MVRLRDGNVELVASHDTAVRGSVQGLVLTAGAAVCDDGGCVVDAVDVVGEGVGSRVGSAGHFPQLFACAHFITALLFSSFHYVSPIHPFPFLPFNASHIHLLAYTVLSFPSPSSPFLCHLFDCQLATQMSA